MAETKTDTDQSYPIFKGLQKPLEFMGIQGRYIYWAAATIGGGILGFMLIYCISSFVFALIFLLVILFAGYILILVKQRRGLHTKKIRKGIFIYSRRTNL